MSAAAHLGERTADGSAGNVGYRTFVDWKRRTHSFDDMVVIWSWKPNARVGRRTGAADGPPCVVELLPDAGYRSGSGTRFPGGREDTPSRSRVLLISDSYWRRRFGADPSVLGRSLLISDEPYIVVGVLPRSYEPLISEHFYERADVWAPLGYDVSLSCACRDCRHLKALGRVRAGTPLDAALADLDTVQQQLVQEFPSAYVRKPMVLAPLWQELTGNLRPALTALMGAVILVVLIACANVANLLLSRLAA